MPYFGILAGPRSRIPSKRACFLYSLVKPGIVRTPYGFGIDKSDVRLILHLGIPTRPEAYYQEAGRAGRDGNQSWCRLLWLAEDLRLAKAMALDTGDTRVARSPDHLRARRIAVETMKTYVTSRRCRRKVLLGYLGERVSACGGCDRCDGHG